MTPIFIKTYPKDFIWLRWCLKAVELHLDASCWGPIYTVTDQEHVTALSDFVAALPTQVQSRIVLINAEANLPGSKDIRFGYVRQQYVKMMSDVITNAPACLHLDSDHFFVRSVTPDDRGMPPFWHVEHYPARYLHDGYRFESPWRALTERVLGFTPECEYVRTVGMWMVAEAQRGVRQDIEVRHASTLLGYFCARQREAPPPKAPAHFSEYDVTGAWTHKNLPHLYEWRVIRDVTRHHPPGWRGQATPDLIFVWSWAGMTPTREQMIDDAIHGRVVVSRID